MTRVSRSIALTGSLVLLTTLGGTMTAAASQRHPHPAPQSVRAGSLPALLDEFPGLGWVDKLLQPGGVRPCDH